jgi:DNA-binding beta-propeller fold protein YncE
LPDSEEDPIKKRIPVGGSPSQGAVDTINEIVYLSGVGGVLSYYYQTKTPRRDSSYYIIPGGDIQNDLFSGVAVDEAKGLLYVCFFTGDRIKVLDLNDDFTVVKEIAGSDGTQSIYLTTE